MGFELQRAQGPARSAQNVSAASAETFDPATSAVVPSASGTLTCRFMDDSADVTVEVLAGVIYPFRLQSVPVGNATAFVALFNGAGR